MDNADSIPDTVWSILDRLNGLPVAVWAVLIAIGFFGSAVLLLTCLYALFPLIAPKPRAPRTSEKQYITVLADGKTSSPLPLPCWYDKHIALKELAAMGEVTRDEAFKIDAAEVFVTLVVPAYNEELRLSGMLEEAVDYLQENYGDSKAEANGSSNGNIRANGGVDAQRGWEILLVSDGSTDKTVDTAFDFARTHQMNKHAVSKGPWKNDMHHGDIPTGAIRVVQLEENRGKGGAVIHGMRHARGRHVVFADADGASKFTDLGKLVSACEKVKDQAGRGVAVGSRAHMVGTDAVVKRSFLRNMLMRAFHLLIRTLTTTKTAEIKDTQCGFKLFSRPSLPYIVPYMHSEGWIFDVEMLMLAESADIPMVEVAIGWKEVLGSKLNVIYDSLGMALGLATLRVGWGLGLYKRD